MEVERLADQMVRSAAEPPPCVGHPAQRSGQIRSAWEQDGEVEEAGGAPGPLRRGGSACQLDDGGLPLDPEADQVRGAVEGPQANRLLVEALRAVEVGDV